MPRPHCAAAAAAADGALPSPSVAADAEAAPRPRRHQRYHPRLAHPPLDHLPSSRHRAASCCWRCGAACRSCTPRLLVRSSVRSWSGRAACVCPIAVISKMARQVFACNVLRHSNYIRRLQVNCSGLVSQLLSPRCVVLVAQATSLQYLRMLPNKTCCEQTITRSLRQSSHSY